MLDNAGFWMVVAICFSLFSGQRLILALSFFLISTLFGYVVNLSLVIEYDLVHLVKSVAAMAFVVVCVNINDRLATYMIITSILFIASQFIGVVIWFIEAPLAIPALLDDIIFTAQIAGFMYAGVYRASISNFTDNLHSIFHKNIT